MFAKLKGIFASKAKSKYRDCKVLIVDDNEVDRRIIEKTLTGLGCRVHLASDGVEGLKMAQDIRPDLILSDCHMPNMDGLTMCKKLKEIQATSEIPLIFLTSVDTPLNVVECFEQEAANFLCKPINPKVLTTQIESILDEYLDH